MGLGKAGGGVSFQGTQDGVGPVGAGAGSVGSLSGMKKGIKFWGRGVS